MSNNEYYPSFSWSSVPTSQIGMEDQEKEGLGWWAGYPGRQSLRSFAGLFSPCPFGAADRASIGRL